MNHPDKPIIFFDGVCALCNSVIDWLFKVDRKNRLYFAPLQGPTARELLPEGQPEKLDSMAFWVDGKLYYKSTGILRTLGQLAWYYRLFMILLIIPTPVRNWAYDFIAKNRYKWFGKKETCRLPTPEERRKFLP